jgi:MFS family permease
MSVVAILDESNSQTTITNENLEMEKNIQDYPEGGYGWVIVFSSFMIHAFTYGVTFCFGVFQEEYISKSTFGNVSTLAIAYIGSLSNAGLGLFAIPSGRLMDIFGHRTMCAVGAIILGFGLVLGSFSTEYYQILLTQGVLFGAGCSISFFPAITILSQWFHKRKGVATGIAVSGSGIGGLLISPLTKWMIDQYGALISLRILGIVCGITVFLSSFLLKTRLPVAEKEKVDYKAIIYDSNFLRLFLISVLLTFGYCIPYFFIPSFATQYRMSTKDGALLVGLVNGANALGRISLGKAADTIGYMNALFLCLFSSGLVTILLWPFAHSFALLTTYGVLYGLFIGGFSSLLPIVIHDLFGAKNLGTTSGLVYFGYMFGYLIGPPTAGAILDQFTTIQNGIKWANYFPSIAICGLSFFIGAIITWSIRVQYGRDILKKI